MAKPLRWSQLTTGILATAGIVVAAVGVLTFGRVGTLHGKTISPYVATDAARGVIRGTEVWLDGQKVGLVRDIGFQSPEAPTKNRVVIALKVLKSAQPHIRVDTRVQVRSGATVIGDQVVYMNSGTAKMREVADGDTIHSHEQVDYESIGSEAAAAGKELPAIFENVKLLTAQLRETQSALAALGADGPEMRRLRAVRRTSGPPLGTQRHAQPHDGQRRLLPCARGARDGADRFRARAPRLRRPFARPAPARFVDRARDHTHSRRHERAPAHGRRYERIDRTIPRRFGDRAEHASRSRVARFPHRRHEKASAPV